MCAYCVVKIPTLLFELLQLRLQGGGLLLVLRREVVHPLHEIVDPRGVPLTAPAF